MEQALRALQQVSHSREPLVAVRQWRIAIDSPNVEKVELSFSKSALTISADLTDDTVQVIGHHASGPTELASASSSEWQRALGLPLANAALQINHQGYLDGVRLEFASSVGNSLILELISSSGLELFVVHPAKA